MVFVTIRGQLFFIAVASEKYKIYGDFSYVLYFPEGTTIFYGYINQKNIVQYYYSRFNYMIIIISTIKYDSIYYNTFTMEVCINYRGYFFQWSFYTQRNINSQDNYLGINKYK